MTLRFGYDRALMRRAMTAWWQSVVPPNPVRWRIIGWSVLWLGLLLLAMVLGSLGIAPSHVVSGILGAAAVMLVFAYLQRTRMARFWDGIARHWNAAGETTATFTPEGLTLSDDVSHRELDWAAVDAVRAIRGGTVFRSGISMIVVPDAALPEKLSPEAFREGIGAWRSA